MFETPGATIQYQHSRRIALSQWTRSDKIRRQREVVIRDQLAQVGPFAGFRPTRTNPQRCAAASTSSATRFFNRYPRATRKQTATR